jgi:hypothetical protein
VSSNKESTIHVCTKASRLALGPTQPPIQWAPGALTLGVKPRGREDNHSPPSSAQVKEWSYTSTPQYASWRGAQLRESTETLALSYIYKQASCLKWQWNNIRGYIQKFPDYLERELQMVQLSATRCSCTAILWVSLVSFIAITLCDASQQVFVAVVSLSTHSGNFWIHPRIYRQL